MVKLIEGLNDLKTTYPDIAKEWDYSKNDKGPEEYLPKSNKLVYWICSKCGYPYKAKISNRANGRGCACCKNKVVVPGVNDLATTHPKLAAEWHPTRNGNLKPTDVSYSSNITMVCKAIRKWAGGYGWKYVDK